MARLVWRYSDDAGAIIENVYKFYMEAKKSGLKLLLNRVWDRTATVTDVSRSTAQKIVERRRRHRTSSNNQSNHRHLRRKSHCMTLTRVLYGGPSPACTPPTPDNIRTELKPSIGNPGSKGRLRKDLLHTKSAYTGCGVNQKELMERQDVVLSRIRYLRMARKLREGATQSFIQIKLTYIPATLSRNAKNTLF